MPVYASGENSRAAAPFNSAILQRAGGGRQVMRGACKPFDPAMVTAFMDDTGVTAGTKPTTAP